MRAAMRTADFRIDLEDISVAERRFTGAGFFTVFGHQSGANESVQRVSLTFRIRGGGERDLLFFDLYSDAGLFVLEGATLRVAWPLHIKPRELEEIS